MARLLKTLGMIILAGGIFCGSKGLWPMLVAGAVAGGGLLYGLGWALSCSDRLTGRLRAIRARRSAGAPAPDLRPDEDIAEVAQPTLAEEPADARADQGFRFDGIIVADQAIARGRRTAGSEGPAAPARALVAEERAELIAEPVRPPERSLGDVTRLPAEDDGVTEAGPPAACRDFGPERIEDPGARKAATLRESRKPAWPARRALGSSLAEMALILVAVGGTGLAFVSGQFLNPAGPRRDIASLERRIESLSRENEALRYQQQALLQLSAPDGSESRKSRQQLLNELQQLLHVSAQLPEPAGPQ